MPEIAEILVQRIDERLAKIQKSRWWLSMQATDRKRHGVVTDIERKGTIPKEDLLRRIAELLNTTTDYLKGLSSSPEPVLSEVTISDHRVEWRGLPSGDGIPLVGTGDCADLEVLDDNGKTVDIERSSFDPEFHIRYIDRPRALFGDPSVYAIYFHGSSMEPRYFAGEIGIAQPSRPAAPGDYVVVQLSDGESHDVVSVLVKRLVRQNSKEIVLEQHNPQLVFSLPRRLVSRVHRIIPPTDLLFR